MEIGSNKRCFSRLVCYGCLLSLCLGTGPGTGWGQVTEEERRLSGVTHPISDAELSTPVAGRVGEYHVEEGDRVKEGQALVQLDTAVQELEVKRRRILRDKLSKELDRLKYLAENTTGVSSEELDKKRSEYEVAVAEYELAQENLNRRKIRAPFSGYVADTYGYEEGEAARANEPLVRLVATKKCVLVCNVKPIYGYEMEVGQEVPIELNAGREQIARKGRVEFVSPVVDAASGLLKIKLIFNNEDGRIRPGESGAILWTKADEQG